MTVSTPVATVPDDAVEAPDDAAGSVEASPGQRLSAVAQQLLVVAIDRLAGAAADKVDDMADQLEGIAQNGGVGIGAAFGAGQAYMAGKNPVWGAVKGGFGALSTGMKVALIAGLVLLGLLSPVALLLILVGLLVAAIVKATRTTG